MTSSSRKQARCGRSFIQWSVVSSSGQPPNRRPDPDFVVDRRRLRQYLASLEGLSGE
ncbi:hypothetical protein [Phormidium sp. FACHB-1136]|uniref:hypothetical protein n=1 Tax=Phormidium sp. FACHB-1136 TaxID=2692848 RepID=UPI0016894C8C|nr:hypothetical protein [Phormidium sp. FACHB-1136]MBD2427210.1 hypothetical protein [Phormidium sp. FACHB-1136]